jgi:hypothetical protein
MKNAEKELTRHEVVAKGEYFSCKQFSSGPVGTDQPAAHTGSAVRMASSLGLSPDDRSVRRELVTSMKKNVDIVQDRSALGPTLASIAGRNAKVRSLVRCA